MSFNPLAPGVPNLTTIDGEHRRFSATVVMKYAYQVTFDPNGTPNPPTAIYDANHTSPVACLGGKVFLRPATGRSRPARG